MNIKKVRFATSLLKSCLILHIMEKSQATQLVIVPQIQQEMLMMYLYISIKIMIKNKGIVVASSKLGVRFSPSMYGNSPLHLLCVWLFESFHYELCFPEL